MTAGEWAGAAAASALRAPEVDRPAFLRRGPAGTYLDQQIHRILAAGGGARELDAWWRARQAEGTR